MKKSEKIEVRLTLDEKTALLQLAEQENRSISELVRGLIERYVTLNASRLPVKPEWGRWAVIGLTGVFLGYISTYLFLNRDDIGPIYTMNAQLYGHVVSVPFIARDGMVTKFTIPDPDGDFIIDARITHSQDELPTAYLTICRKIEARCEVLATPVLTFNPNDVASINFNDDHGEFVSVWVKASGSKRPMNTKKRL